MLSHLVVLFPLEKWVREVPFPDLCLSRRTSNPYPQGWNNDDISARDGWWGIIPRQDLYQLANAKPNTLYFFFIPKPSPPICWHKGPHEAGRAVDLYAPGPQRGKDGNSTEAPPWSKKEVNLQFSTPSSGPKGEVSQAATPPWGPAFITLLFPEPRMRSHVDEGFFLLFLWFYSHTHKLRG